MRKVLSFIVIENAGSIQECLNYLSQYPDQFNNVAICPVAFPFVMYKFFGSVYEVVSHNKPRQSDLDLEKFWIYRYGWLQLFKTVAMGTTINNFRKPFCYGVKRYHQEKLIGIRAFSELLALYFFKIIFQLILGTKKRTCLPLTRSVMDRMFLLDVHFIFPVVFIFPQWPELFTT